MDNHTTELVFFSGFDLNVAEAEAMEIVRGVEGCYRVHHGIQVKDPTRGLWVQDWASLGHHEAFQATEGYPAFVAGASGFSKSVDRILHVIFHPEEAFSAALKATQTELQIVELRKGESYDDFSRTIQEVNVRITKELPGDPGYASGVTLEDGNVCILVKGWKSLEESLANSLDFGAECEEIVANVKIQRYTLSE